MTMKTVLTKIKSFLGKLWPKMDPDLRGAKQKIPFNINRFVLLVIALIYTAASACVYFDWSAVRNLLIQANKYEELNDGPFSDIVDTKQYKAINKLYPTTVAIHFTTSVFCGFLFDHIGPKLTAVLGQLLNIMCWVFLSLDTKSFNSTLTGFVFMGLGADTAFIPVLTIANVFPDASTFILTLIGAAASLSFAVPTVLSLCMNVPGKMSFASVCYGYIGVILVPCLLVALLLFPLKPFKGIDDFLREDREKENGMLETTTGSNIHGETSVKNAYGANLNYPQDNDNTTVDNYEQNILEMDKKKVNTQEVIHKKGSGAGVHLKEQNELADLAGNIDNESNYNDDKKKSKHSLLDLEALNISENDKHYHWLSIKLFFKLLISYPSICIIVYFVIFNISMVFYGMVNDTYFDYDKSIITAINILFPLSFIPCIIFGRLVNRYGAAIIILCMNACSFIMHFTALIKYSFFGFTSAFFYTCATSMYTSQIYCFIKNAFPTTVFGKFVGFASLCGGIFSLCSELLYNYITKRSEEEKIDPSNVSHSLILTFLILFIPLSILKVRNYERIPELITSEKEKKNSIVHTSGEEVFSTI